jgi:polyhydroxyalkanoate synthesis repressor PhaR
MSQERVIRKYANRRLYDTQASRHVTLADLRALITAGENIKVVDDKSGEDLTRSVLLQIIAEQEQFGAPVLSTELLEMIIRYYASPMQTMLSEYLEQGFAALMKQQDAMRVDMSKALSGTSLAPFVDLARANMEAFAKMQSSFFGVGDAPSRPAAAERAQSAGAQSSREAPVAAGAGAEPGVDSEHCAGVDPKATDKAAR